jgi:hypothetical protein
MSIRRAAVAPGPQPPAVNQRADQGCARACPARPATHALVAFSPHSSERRRRAFHGSGRVSTNDRPRTDTLCQWTLVAAQCRERRNPYMHERPRMRATERAAACSGGSAATPLRARSGASDQLQPALTSESPPTLTSIPVRPSTAGRESAAAGPEPCLRWVGCRGQDRTRPRPRLPPRLVFHSKDTRPGVTPGTRGLGFRASWTP